MTLLLLRAGLASALCACGLALAAPLEVHVPAFLLVFAAWSVVSWSLWRSLPRAAGGDERGRAALILVLAAFVRLPLVLLAPTPSTDAYRYSWEGRVLAAGRDPYLEAPSDAGLDFLRTPQDVRVNNPGLTTIYPPLALASFRLVAAASADARAPKAFFALCDLAVCLLLTRLLRRRGLPVALAAVYAWHPLAAVEFAAAGHLDSLLILGLLAGLDLWDRGRRDSAAVVWAAAALVKVVPVALLPFLLARRRRSALLFAAVLAAGLAPAAPGLLAALRSAPRSGLAAYGAGWLANPSLHAVLGLVWPSELGRRALSAAALAAASLPWARRCGDDAARYLLGALTAVLLASPVVQPWYVLWLVPFALLRPFPAALAWSWTVGGLYAVFDPRLSVPLLGLAPWQWVWLGEYAVVYGLLARSALTAL